MSENENDDENERMRMRMRMRMRVRMRKTELFVIDFFSLSQSFSSFGKEDRS
jgi:hypothetical protein